MFPLLLEIPILGGIRIYTYGVLVATAFMMGILWTIHETRQLPLGQKNTIKPEQVTDLAFYIILAALIGSRILYVLVDWNRYVSHPLDIFKIWEGGLVFYGGLIGAIFVSLYYLRKHHLGFLKVADLFMPGVALGHAIGRLGCLASGCCYGRVTHSAFSILFPQSRFTLAPPGIPLFPSQPLESAVELGIFFLLILIRKGKKFDGQVFLVYLILYSISRSILEIFRGDSVRGFIIPDRFSTSQLISAILVFIAIILYAHLRKKTKQEKAS